MAEVVEVQQILVGVFGEGCRDRSAEESVDCDRINQIGAVEDVQLGGDVEDLGDAVEEGAVATGHLLDNCVLICDVLVDLFGEVVAWVDWAAESYWQEVSTFRQYKFLLDVIAIFVGWNLQRLAEPDRYLLTGTRWKQPRQL